MPIWELKPADFDHPGWRATEYSGRVVVRAEDEDAARGLVYALDRKKKIRYRIKTGDLVLMGRRSTE